MFISLHLVCNFSSGWFSVIVDTRFCCSLSLTEMLSCCLAICYSKLGSCTALVTSGSLTSFCVSNRAVNLYLPIASIKCPEVDLQLTVVGFKLVLPSFSHIDL